MLNTGCDCRPLSGMVVSISINLFAWKYLNLSK